MAYNFSGIDIECDNIAFLVGHYFICVIVKSLNNIKQINRKKYGVSNVNGAVFFFLTSVYVFYIYPYYSFLLYHLHKIKHILIMLPSFSQLSISTQPFIAHQNVLVLHYPKSRKPEFCMHWWPHSSLRIARPEKRQNISMLISFKQSKSVSGLISSRTCR